MTDTPEMVERAAKALYENVYGPGHWDNTAPHIKGLWYDRVRAVIKAMREPTEAMLVAVWPPEQTERTGKSPDDAWQDQDITAIDVWQAMIDAALQAPEKPVEGE